MKRSVVLALCLMSTLASPATWAKALYVNPATGDDAVSWTNNSSTRPWRTLGRAVWGSSSRSSPNAAEAARAGDTVYVAAGVYTSPGTGIRYEPSYNPVNNGSAAEGYISFEAQGQVVLQLNSSNGPVIGGYGKSYIRWKGFYINETNAPYRSDTGLITIFSSNNIVIEGNEVVGIATTVQDNHNGVRIEGSSFVTLTNNRIHGVTYDPSGWDTSHNAAGVMLYGSNNITIEHNEIFDSNAGIFPKGNDNYNIVIRRNLIHNCIKGIRISYSHPTLGQNLVYQNVIRDGNTRGETVGINVAENTNNYTFANNTIDNVQNGIYFSNSANQSNLVFRNNVITNTNNAFNAYVANSRAFTLDNQNYFNTNEWAYGGVIYYTLSAWRSAIAGDGASSTSDPQYMDNAINNFRLRSTSPAINSGVDILDLNNNGNRGDAVNLGAYLTGNEQIGRLAGNTLEAPTRLRLAR